MTDDGSRSDLAPPTFFLHTHKCAGTSVIDLFRRHPGTRMHPSAQAGMPPFLHAMKGITSAADLATTYSNDRVLSKLNEWKRARITFVASEWVCPPLAETVSAAGYRSFTVLRDPLKRHISNFRFDIARGYSNAPDIWRYSGPRNFRQPNYFTRLLSTHHIDDTSPVTARDFEVACRQLECMDVVIFLEEPHSMRQLSVFGVDPDELRQENMGSPATERTAVDDDFARLFRVAAAWDYRLLEVARQMHLGSSSSTTPSGG